MRLPQKTQARRSLKNSLEVRENRRGRARSTWISLVKKDLRARNVTLDLKKAKGTIETLDESTLDRELNGETL